MDTVSTGYNHNRFTSILLVNIAVNIFTITNIIPTH